jgi:hypothetical protein
MGSTILTDKFWDQKHQGLLLGRSMPGKNLDGRQDMVVNVYRTRPELDDGIDRTASACPPPAYREKIFDPPERRTAHVDCNCPLLQVYPILIIRCIYQ